MIASIAVENFKAFGKKQKLPVKPITLIFGPNSSGKSSIIHSLLFAQHALQTGKLDVFRPKGGGDSVDLGGFKQYIFKRNSENLFTWSIEIDVAQLKDELSLFLSPAKQLEMSVSVRLPQKEISPGEYVSAENPIVSSFFVSADGEDLFSFGARKDNSMRMERLNHQHPIFKNLFKSIIEVSTTVQNIQPGDFDALGEGLLKILPKMEFVCEKYLPQSRLKSEADTAFYEAALIPIGRGDRKESIASTMELILPRKIAMFLKDLNSAVSGYFENLAYLGPLRSYPPRHLAFLENEDHNWFAGGGFAWEVLRKDENVREKVNEWLGEKDKLQTPYHLKLQQHYKMDQLEAPIWEGLVDLETYIKQLGEVELQQDISIKGMEFIEERMEKLYSNPSFTDLVLVDQRTDTEVSHRDVGIGISQIIPVLVNAYANQNKIIAIEQPEIHIHPGLQAELGDLFIESALGENKNTFLIETHSEHLLLRIMKRMRQTANGELPQGKQAITPEDIAVVYVEPLENQSIIREMPLNIFGELVKAWPGGFFEEGLREVF